MSNGVLKRGDASPRIISVIYKPIKSRLSKLERVSDKRKKRTRNT